MGYQSEYFYYICPRSPNLLEMKHKTNLMNILAACLALSVLFSCSGASVGVDEDKDIPVSSVSLSQATAEMLVGETVRLIAMVTPSNSTDKTVVWASSKQSVATIDQTGLLTAVAEGTSTVTASVGGKSATCTVTVSKAFKAVSEVILDIVEVEMRIGESFTLTATVKPDDATDKTVSWESSDPSVVTVSDGLVTAVSSGSATVMATAGEKSASCQVTVSLETTTVPVLDEDSFFNNESYVRTFISGIYSNLSSFFLDKMKLEEDLVAGRFVNLSPFSTVILNLWTKGYQVLSRSVLVTDALESRGIFPEYKAHVQILRGLIGYHLATMWGDVPYYTTMPDDPFILGTMSRADILDSALRDLQEVPDDYDRSFSGIVRNLYINPDARRIIEAEILLTVGRKAEAKALLEPLTVPGVVP